MDDAIEEHTVEDIRSSLEAGFTIPSSWYHDPTIFHLEQDRILRRSWHYVTHVGTLAEPGDVLPWEVAGVPIVLTRTPSGEIHGFVNICQHRAHPVVLEPGNQRSLTCMYHGWSYDLEGGLKNVPRANGDIGFDPATVCLRRIQTHVWGPMVWVNVSLDAPPFEEWTAGLDDRLRSLGCDVREFAHATEHTWHIDANWKVFQDNTIECYHCPTTHPEFSRAVVMDPAQQRMEVGGRYWIHHTIPFRDGVDEGITFKRVAGEPFNYHYSWIFPTTYLQHSGRGFDIGTLDVVAVDRMRFRHMWFGPTDTPPETIALGQRMLEADVTIQQDVDLCGRVQRAHASGFAPTGRLVPGREALLTHFYKLIAELVEPGGPSSKSKVPR
jgi:phenylpropionate dioxygenase-like ring-hydroxylating dioxygenase large terminal subunit